MIVLSPFDYALQIAINSIGANSLDEAVSQSSFGDAVWSGVNSLVENNAMGVSLDCIRKIILANYEKETLVEQLSSCGRSALISIINERVIHNGGKYASMIRNKLMAFPKETISFLKKYNITDE